MRRTRQRELVWETVRSAGPHVTADEIAVEIRKQQPGFSRSTVYRALEALATSGDVRTLRLGTGAVLYECGTLGEHQHAVCQSCEAILHLEPELVDELERHLEEMHRFRPIRTDVVVVGTCDGCARSGGPADGARRRTLEHAHLSGGAGTRAK
jgi:Fur family transcriptional regulator, ferric uptake regulator